MKQASVLAIILACLGNISSYGADSGAEFKEIKSADGNFTLAYKAEGEKIAFKMTCATDGWVGLGLYTPGFTREKNKMEGAAMVLGFVAAGVTNAAEHYGTGMFSHKALLELQAGTFKSELSAVSGKEEVVGGKTLTTIEFSLPLTPSNATNRVTFKVGQPQEIMWACGKAGVDAFAPGRHAIAGRETLLIIP